MKEYIEVITAIGFWKGFAVIIFATFVYGVNKIYKDHLGAYLSKLLQARLNKVELEYDLLRARLPDAGIWALIRGQYTSVYAKIADEINTVFDKNNRADVKRQKAIPLEIKAASRLAVDEAIRDLRELYNTESTNLASHLIAFRSNQMKNETFWAAILTPIIRETDAKIARQAALISLKTSINLQIEDAFFKLKNSKPMKDRLMKSEHGSEHSD